jgi:hypothetical protein
MSERRDPSTYDNYNVSLNLVYPKSRNNITWSGSQSAFWEASMRIEPCGSPELISSHHKVNVSQNQGTHSDEVYIRRYLSIVLEDTLVPELPYSTNIVGDGLKRYRTVQMTKLEGYLVISLTSTIDISNVITEVILATGNQCIENYDPNSKYRIAKIVPRVLNYNITVPAQNIWYIGFVTTGQPGEIKVDFIVVDKLTNNTLPDIILPNTPDIALPPIPDLPLPKTPVPSPSGNNNTHGDPLSCDFLNDRMNMLLILVVLLFLLNIIFLSIYGGYALLGPFMKCSDSKKEVSLDNLKVYSK